MPRLSLKAKPSHHHHGNNNYKSNEILLLILRKPVCRPTIPSTRATNSSLCDACNQQFGLMQQCAHATSHKGKQK